MSERSKRRRHRHDRQRSPLDFEQLERRVAAGELLITLGAVGVASSNDSVPLDPDGGLAPKQKFSPLDGPLEAVLRSIMADGRQTTQLIAGNNEPNSGPVAVRSDKPLASDFDEPARRQMGGLSNPFADRGLTTGLPEPIGMTQRSWGDAAGRIYPLALSAPAVALPINLAGFGAELSGATAPQFGGVTAERRNSCSHDSAKRTRLRPVSRDPRPARVHPNCGRTKVCWEGRMLAMLR